MTDTTATTKVSRPGVGARIAALTSAGLLALLAVGLLAAGGVLLWADSRKDEQGYFSTGTDRFSTGTYALATEELDVDADVPGWLLDRDRYGQVRLRVTSNDGKPVFVGIAPTRDVERYLDRTAHTTVTDLDYAPFHADYRDHAGARPSTPPSRQAFWTASAQGTDTQTVRWDVEQGSWTVVVMNADGSAGVDAGISAGAKVPFLAPVGWGVLG
ncbi:MAG TPA: hypothetical protein VN213_11250, partial [Solirubrobacteraceae bacterium]|nr:hypothetical protein [Solirubrobacteraceae bacterium]